MKSLQEMAADIAALLPGAEKAKQLEIKLEAKEADITSLNGKLSAKDAEILDLKGKLEAKDKEISKLNADHKTAIDAKEADVEKRAGLKAAEIAAGKGLGAGVKDEGKGGESTATATGKTKLEQYNALVSEGDAKAAAAFFKENEKEIHDGK
jgi:predicted RNase H-like nuclease (RuvC/YqgF family)